MSLILVATASATPGSRRPHALAYLLDRNQAEQQLVVETGRRRRTIIPPSLLSAVAWSPSRDAVAVIRPLGRTRQVLELVTTGGARRRLLEVTPAAILYGVAWSPDGRSLALLEHDSRARGLVTVVDLARVRRRTLVRIGTLGRIDWSRRGQLVVPTTEPHPFSRLALVDVATGRVRRVPGANGRGAAFSPDGKELAYSGQRGIVVLELATRRLRQVTHGGWQDDEPAWSPDGTMLVYSHASGHCSTPAPGQPCNFELFTVPTSGGKPLNLTRTPTTLERTPTWLR